MASQNSWRGGIRAELMTEVRAQAFMERVVEVGSVDVWRPSEAHCSPRDYATAICRILRAREGKGKRDWENLMKRSGGCIGQ